MMRKDSENFWKENAAPVTVNVYGGQINIANDQGKIEANQHGMDGGGAFEAPDLKIIQNLWSETPGFKLMNDSDVRLPGFEAPSYLMFIPSKIYCRVKETGGVVSLLTLSPISYEVIVEQISTGSTKGEISTSKLPVNFKGKLGERDVVRGGIVEETDDLIFWVNTYPFLVIVSDLTYAYQNKEYREIIVSTPLGNAHIDEVAYGFLLDYARDNAKYEIKVADSGESAYQMANEKVKELFANLKDNPTFFCGKEGGYGNVLKLINQIITPNDILG